MVVASSRLQKRVLFLITSSFPFGEFESFLETEWPYLYNSFDTIFIITTELSGGSTRIDNTSVQVHYLKYLPNWLDKLKYPRYLFNSYALKELQYLFQNPGITVSRGVLSSVAGSVTFGYKLRRKIVALMDQHKLWREKVYAYSYWCNDSATGLALLKKAHPGIICITRAHGYDVYLNRNKYGYLPFRKMIFSTLGKVFFVSEHGKNYTIDKFGQFPSFQVSYLGVEQGTQHTSESPTSNWNLISCSSVIPLKRIHLVIEALALFKEDRIHWTHIGAGKDLVFIEQYANKLIGSKSNISFEFTGQLSNKDVLQWYHTHDTDLFISASLYEGLPVSMMEAMAHGIPVLGPDVGGVGEVVEDGLNGILIKQELNASILHKAIRSYFDKSFSARVAMATDAKRTWKEKFQASLNYSEFIEYLFNG